MDIERLQQELSVYFEIPTRSWLGLVSDVLITTIGVQHSIVSLHHAPRYITGLRLVSLGAGRC